MKPRFEFRVLWRRTAWRPKTCSRFRLFARHRDAVAYASKLTSDSAEWAHLSRIVVTIQRRKVEGWEPVK
jgi:hypothetical protein